MPRGGGGYGLRRGPTATGFRNNPLCVRMSDRELARVEDQRWARGFATMSGYIRDLIEKDGLALAKEGESNERQ